MALSKKEKDLAQGIVDASGLNVESVDLSLEQLDDKLGLTANDLGRKQLPLSASYQKQAGSYIAAHFGRKQLNAILELITAWAIERREAARKKAKK